LVRGIESIFHRDQWKAKTYLTEVQLLSSQEGIIGPIVVAVTIRKTIPLRIMDDFTWKRHSV